MSEELSRDRVRDATIFHSRFVGEEPFNYGPLDPDALGSLACIAAEVVDFDLLVRVIKTMNGEVASEFLQRLMADVWAFGFKSAATAIAPPVGDRPTTRED